MKPVRDSNPHIVIDMELVARHEAHAPRGASAPLGVDALPADVCELIARHLSPRDLGSAMLAHRNFLPSASSPAVWVALADRYKASALLTPAQQQALAHGPGGEVTVAQKMAFHGLLSGCLLGIGGTAGLCTWAASPSAPYGLHEFGWAMMMFALPVGVALGAAGGLAGSLVGIRCQGRRDAELAQATDGVLLARSQGAFAQGLLSAYAQTPFQRDSGYENAFESLRRVTAQRAEQVEQACSLFAKALKQQDLPTLANLFAGKAPPEPVEIDPAIGQRALHLAARQHRPTLVRGLMELGVSLENHCHTAATRQHLAKQFKSACKAANLEALDALFGCGLDASTPEERLALEGAITALNTATIEQHPTLRIALSRLLHAAIEAQEWPFVKLFPLGLTYTLDKDAGGRSAAESLHDAYEEQLLACNWAVAENLKPHWNREASAASGVETELHALLAQHLHEALDARDIDRTQRLVGLGARAASPDAAGVAARDKFQAWLRPLIQEADLEAVEKIVACGLPTSAGAAGAPLPWANLMRAQPRQLLPRHPLTAAAVQEALHDAITHNRWPLVRALYESAVPLWIHHNLHANAGERLRNSCAHAIEQQDWPLVITLRACGAMESHDRYISQHREMNAKLDAALRVARDAGDNNQVALLKQAGAQSMRLF